MAKSFKDVVNIDIFMHVLTKDFFILQFYTFIIWCFFNLIKPDEVGKPITNETSLQY